MPKNPDNTPKSHLDQTPGGRLTPLRPGESTVLGDFELRREIGRGGMGTVYEAWQLSLQRFVALKVLGQHISGSPVAVQRFQLEAHAAAKLHHMHIIPIYAQGETDGVHYYAMELVEGPTLHDIIAPPGVGQPTWPTSSDSDETVLLDRSMVAAVDRSILANGEGGEHPEEASAPPCAGTASVNLPDEFCRPEHFTTVARHIASTADALEYAHKQGVVHRDIKPHNLIFGRDDRLRLSDFGLARVAEEPGVTVTGELIGSPLYMSPEQITPDYGQVDHRTDIYSLGATMYEWLTLTPPYPGDTRERVISRILSSEPAPLRMYNPHIPVDLETICLRAIERDRNRRYQTAGALRDDLERFLKNRPIQAKRTGLTGRFRKFIVRHPVASVAAVAGSAVVALASALYVSHLRVQSQKHEVESQAAFIAEAQQQTDNLLDLFKPLLPVDIETPLSIVEAARPMLEGVFEAGEATAWSSGAGGSRGADSALASKPEEIAQRAISDLYAAIAPRYWPSSPLARECSYAALGGIEMSETGVAKARRTVDQCLLSYPDHVEARQLHLALCGQMRQYDTMASDAQQLIRGQRQDPTAYLWLGLAHLLLDDAPQGHTDFDHAAELAGRRDVRYVWARALRGLALIHLGRLDDALVELNETLVLAPNLVVALLARASVGAALGDLAGAVADLTRAIEQEPDNADTVALRGEHSAKLGRFDAAIRDFDEAMRMAGPTPTLQVQRFYAQVKQQQGNNRPGPAEPPMSEDSVGKLNIDQSSGSRRPRPYHPEGRSGTPRGTGFQPVECASLSGKLLFAEFRQG